MALRIAVIHQLSHGNGLSKGPILQLKDLHGAGAKLSARPLHHNPCKRLAPRCRWGELDHWLKPLFALGGVTEEECFQLITSFCSSGRWDSKVSETLSVSMLVFTSGPINFYCVTKRSHFWRTKNKTKKTHSPTIHVHWPISEIPRTGNCPSCILCQCNTHRLGNKPTGMEMAPIAIQFVNFLGVCLCVSQQVYLHLEWRYKFNR